MKNFKKISGGLLLACIMMAAVFAVTGIASFAYGEDPVSTTKKPYTGYAAPADAKKGIAVGSAYEASQWNAPLCMFNLQYSEMVHSVSKSDYNADPYKDYNWPDADYLYTYGDRYYYFNSSRVSNMRSTIIDYKNNGIGKLVVVKMYNFEPLPGITYDVEKPGGVVCIALDPKNEANIKKLFGKMAQYLGSCVDYWCIGNEIDCMPQYNYTGKTIAEYGETAYANDQAFLMKTLHNVVSCYNGNAGILVSIDQGWNMSDVNHFSSKNLILQIDRRAKELGDFCWGLAPQSYNIRHTDIPGRTATPEWWTDTTAFPGIVTSSADSPLLVAANLDMIVNFFSKSPALLYQGKQRPILITEIAFSAHRDGQEDLLTQARALEKFYNDKIKNNSGIIGFIYNNQRDVPSEGVWFRMNGRPIERVFRNLETGDYTIALDGDINGDQKVDLQDVLMIKRHLAGVATLTAGQQLMADVDYQEGIDPMDAIILQRYILGMLELPNKNSSY